MRYSDYSYSGRILSSTREDRYGDQWDDGGYRYDDWGWHGSGGNGWCNWYGSWCLDWQNPWNCDGSGWWNHWWKSRCRDDNTPPDAVDDALTVLEPGGTITGNLLDNDTDDDGDTLTVTHINGVATQVGVPVVLPEGEITVEADGTYTVQAAEDFSFTYTISDGEETDTATVDVNVVEPLFFLAPRGETAAVWKTNGTPDGTIEMLNFNDAGARFADHLTAFKGGFLFQGADDDKGSEPWFSDGTVGGTFRLADLFADTRSSSPINFTVLGDIAVFTAIGGGVGNELFVTDGTPGGTGLLKDIKPGLAGDSTPSAYVVVGDLVFFTAGTTNEGSELWRTDGTADGTILVKDLLPGPGSSNPQSLFELDGQVVFRANRDNSGVELWISDGTPDDALLLSDDAFGAGSGPDGDAFFLRRDAGGTYDLWRSDGTVDGTAMVADINTNGTGGGDFTQLGDSFFFAANYRQSLGFELWKTDGTEEGTMLVENINSSGGGPGFQLPTPAFARLADGLIFKANDGINGLEPWFTDGTAEGTTLLKDINPNGSSMGPNDRFTYHEGRVVFAAITPDEGRELWISDGTPEGTSLLADIVPGPESSSPDYFIV